MEEKQKRSFLRWPWNVVIYVLLAVVFRIFSIPIILFLVWYQQKNNPHGIAEGYCLSRTRKHLSWLLWSLLLLFLSVCLAVYFLDSMKTDRGDWGTNDYVTLVISACGTVVLAAADCLALRVPDARRGKNDQYANFLQMDESQREEFERDFRQKQNHRASDQALQESMNGPQDMILKCSNGEVTSRVSVSLVEDTLKRCLAGEEAGFELIPTRPIEGENRTFRSLRCQIWREAEGVPEVELILTGEKEDSALALTTDGRCTVEATRPGGPELEFYITKMPPRRAAEWLTGYPGGEYLPGGPEGNAPGL